MIVKKIKREVFLGVLSQMEQIGLEHYTALQYTNLHACLNTFSNNEFVYLSDFATKKLTSCFEKCDVLKSFFIIYALLSAEVADSVPPGILELLAKEEPAKVDEQKETPKKRAKKKA